MATGKKTSASGKSSKKSSAKPASKKPTPKKATSAKKTSAKKTSAKKTPSKKKPAAKQPIPKPEPRAPKPAAAGAGATGSGSGSDSGGKQPKGSGFSSLDVNMGHVFTLRPRIPTAFRPDDFRAARQMLAGESFANAEAAARAVAEKALELSHDGVIPGRRGHGPRRW